MSQWQLELDIVDDWKKCLNDEITFYQLATSITTKLKKLKIPKGWPEYIEDEKNIVIQHFSDIFVEESSENIVEEFDNVMSLLYDWADISLDGNFGGKKVCWVKTF